MNERDNDRATSVLDAVAQRLLRERVRLGMDLEAAADAAAIEPERLARAEAGEVALDENELARLADVYSISVAAFFGGRVTPFQYLAGT